MKGEALVRVYDARATTSRLAIRHWAALRDISQYLEDPGSVAPSQVAAARADLNYLVIRIKRERRKLEEALKEGLVEEGSQRELCELALWREMCGL